MAVLILARPNFRASSGQKPDGPASGGGFLF